MDKSRWIQRKFMESHVGLNQRQSTKYAHFLGLGIFIIVLSTTILSWLDLSSTSPKRTNCFLGDHLNKTCLIYLNLNLPHYLSLLCQTPPNLSFWKQIHQSLQQEQYSCKRTRVGKLTLSLSYPGACLRLNIVTRFMIESS